MAGASLKGIYAFDLIKSNLAPKLELRRLSDFGYSHDAQIVNLQRSRPVDYFGQ